MAGFTGFVAIDTTVPISMDCIGKSTGNHGWDFKVIKYGYWPVDFPSNPLSSSPVLNSSPLSIPASESTINFGPPPIPAPPALRPTWPKGSATWRRRPLSQQSWGIFTMGIFVWGRSQDNQTWLENPLSWRLSTVTPPNKKMKNMSMMYIYIYIYRYKGIVHIYIYNTFFVNVQ